jgi:DNA polymerase-3 subunit epsilon
MILRPIFYDTETTGIKPDKDRIIELAAFDPVENRTFVELINPECLIPSDATAIHHITNEMVETRPNFNEIGKKFIDFCPNNAVLIAHNNDAFDLPFLRQEFSRSNLKMPTWQFFDTLKWARRYRPDLPRHTLQFLREMYDIAPNNAHRALDDVIILHGISCFLLDDLTIEQAIALLNTAPVRELTVMPFGKHQGKLLKEIPKDYVKWLQTNGAFDKPDSQALRESFVKLGLITN